MEFYAKPSPVRGDRTAINRIWTIWCGALLYFQSQCRTRADDFRFVVLLNNVATFRARIARDPWARVAAIPPKLQEGEHYGRIEDVYAMFGRDKARKWAAKSAGEGNEGRRFLDDLWQRQCERMQACRAALVGLTPPPQKKANAKLGAFYAELANYVDVGALKFRAEVERVVAHHFPPVIDRSDLQRQLADFLNAAPWRVNTCGLDDLRDMADCVEYFAEAAAYLSLAGAPAAPEPNNVTPTVAINYAEALARACAQMPEDTRRGAKTTAAAAGQTKYPAEHFLEEYKIAPETLNKRRERGGLPSAEKVDGRWRYAEEEVRAAYPHKFK